MNIIGYASKYSDQSFSVLPFNEVDALIFAELAYINFDLYVKDEFIKFKDLKIVDKKAFYYGSVDKKYNQTLFEIMQKSKRYKNVEAGNVKCIIDKKTAEQFFAITFRFLNGDGYIAFRGTDITILGWQEDFMFAYQDDIPSQKRAEKYIGSATNLLNNFYIGGHSKGGNLAIYSAFMIKDMSRLIKAYSFDGPGFRTDVEEKLALLISENKLEKYLTNNDVIGVVYNKVDNAKIVYSNGLLLGGHDPFFWRVRNKYPEFSYAKNRTYFSKKHEEAMMNWMRNIPDDDKFIACKLIVEFFSESETVYDLLKNLLKNLTKGNKVFKNLTEEERKRGIRIIAKLVKYYAKAYNPIKIPSKQVKQIS